MKLTHSALTGDVLVKFENLYKYDFSKEEKETFEHLAYCSCMAGRSFDEDWNRFCELVKNEYDIDLTAMHNDTVDTLIDFVLSAVGMNRYEDTFNMAEVERSVNIIVYAHRGSLEEAVLEAVKTFRTVSKWFKDNRGEK